MTLGVRILDPPQVKVGTPIERRLDTIDSALTVGLAYVGLAVGDDLIYRHAGASTRANPAGSARLPNPHPCGDPFRVKDPPFPQPAPVASARLYKLVARVFK